MNLFNELKRRNVFRVAIAYLVIAWLMAQVSATLEDALNLPQWFDTMVVTLLMLGFPFTLFFSWAFEITSEGIKREVEVERDVSIAHITAKKLDYITLVALFSVVGLVFWQQTHIDSVAKHRNVVADLSENATVKLNTIAVLPFANRSNLEDDLYFTDGIHDDILTQLSKIKAIKVISRTSVMQYRNSKKTIADVAKELGVSAVLEGGIQRAGNRIRVNAQLIDVATDEHLWAEIYDREMTVENLFDIQSEVTKHIVTAIRGELTPQELSTIEHRPTNNLSAWEFLSQAKAVLRNSGYNAQKYLSALKLAEQAALQDPEFTDTWVLMANIHSSIYWSGFDPTLSRQKLAMNSLDKAVALAPNSAEVLAAQGEYYYRIELDYPKALKFQQQAMALNPSNSEIIASLGLTQRRLGLWQQSVDNLLKASELDPGDENHISAAAATLDMIGDAQRLRLLLSDAMKRYPNSSDLGATVVDYQIWAYGDLAKARQIYLGIKPEPGDAYVSVTLSLYWFERDYQAVIDTFERKEIQDFFSLYLGTLDVHKAQAYQQLGNQALMNKHLLKAIELLTPIDHQRSKFNVAVDLSTLATAHALMGHHDKAIALVNEMIELFPLDRDIVDGAFLHMSASYALAIADQHERALALIEKLLNTPGGFKRWNLYLDPNWDFMRKNQRFNQLIKPLNLAGSKSVKN